MKNGKNPTMEQKIKLKSLKLDSRAWLIVKDLPSFLLVEHRVSGETRLLEFRKEN